MVESLASADRTETVNSEGSSTVYPILSARETSKLNVSDESNFQGISYDKNIIPSFDPAQKNQRIFDWIAKVNACAKICNWTNEQTAHFALPKLTGHARKWYEGLKKSLETDLLSWSDWQERLSRAFPLESNYAVLLTEMLERRMKIGESVDEYYYGKMMLLNSCEIRGKKAVDCILHGIDDRMIRISASSARVKDPEDLFKILKNLCIESNFKTFRQQTANEIICLKCKKPGHCMSQCSSCTEIICHNCLKALNRCETCRRTDHKTCDCYFNKFINNATLLEKQKMLSRSNKTNSKFRKEAIINGNIKINSYIDIGSDSTLIRRDVVEKHLLPVLQDKLPALRGFGNNVYIPLGKVHINLTVGEIVADIDAYIVESSMLLEPMLIGQNFTEQPDIVIVKTNDSLFLLKGSLPQIPVTINGRG